MIVFIFLFMSLMVFLVEFFGVGMNIYLFNINVMNVVICCCMVEVEMIILFFWGILIFFSLIVIFWVFIRILDWGIDVLFLISMVFLIFLVRCFRINLVVLSICGIFCGVDKFLIECIVFVERREIDFKGIFFCIVIIFKKYKMVFNIFL